MCSTTAGPRRGSAPAGNIIPSSRSRCRSRRCPGRGCSGTRPQQLLAAAEAVTVQNDMSSAHITFIDEAGAAECERRGWLIRARRPISLVQPRLSRSSTISSPRSASRKRKAIRKERAAAREGLEFSALRGARDRRRPSGTRCGPSIRTPARANGAGPISPASSSTWSASGWATRCCCSSPAATAGRSPARSTSSAPDTLYGRYWGCTEEVPFLHFELCYYQAIEWAIDHGLACGPGRRAGRAQARARL